MDRITALMNVQKRLKAAGYYTSPIDGKWGGGSIAALNNAVLDGRGGEMSPEFDLAWSAKLSYEFMAKVHNFNTMMRLTEADQPHYINGCMAFETGRTFSPSVQNYGGAKYFGLIQWGDMAASDVKMTTAQLIRLSAEQQFDYVAQWFKPYSGKIKTLSDVYMRIFMPAFIGKPENAVLASAGVKTYSQNRGLDINNDGVIQKHEAAAQVMAQLQLGMQPSNRRLLIS